MLLAGSRGGSTKSVVVSVAAVPGRTGAPLGGACRHVTTYGRTVSRLEEECIDRLIRGVKRKHDSVGRPVPPPVVVPDAPPLVPAPLRLPPLGEPTGGSSLSGSLPSRPASGSAFRGVPGPGIAASAGFFVAPLSSAGGSSPSGAPPWHVTAGRCVPRASVSPPGSASVEAPGSGSSAAAPLGSSLRAAAARPPPPPPPPPRAG